MVGLPVGLVGGLAVDQLLGRSGNGWDDLIYAILGLIIGYTIGVSIRVYLIGRQLNGRDGISTRRRANWRALLGSVLGATPGCLLWRLSRSECEPGGATDLPNRSAADWSDIRLQHEPQGSQVMYATHALQYFAPTAGCPRPLGQDGSFSELKLKIENDARQTILDFLFSIPPILPARLSLYKLVRNRIFQ